MFSQSYGESAGVTCGQARASKWHKLKKKCTIRLPPDEDSLDRHVERTNYITYCQLHYNLQEHPPPIGHGWELVNGKCRPVRHTLPPLPQQLTAQMRVAVMMNGVGVENQQILMKNNDPVSGSHHPSTISCCVILSA